MTDDMLASIKSAVKVVEDGAAKRVDGDGFKVYRVVDIIRVDINMNGKE